MVLVTWRYKGGFYTQLLAKVPDAWYGVGVLTAAVAMLLSG